MSNVYITNASLNQISKSLRGKKTRVSRNSIIEDLSSDFDSDSIISQDSLHNIFNSNELQEIYYMKMLLKDFAKLLDTIQDNKNIITKFIKSQNSKYAYDVKAPSYHRETSCQWMNKSFHNIEIADKCINNEKMKKEAKDWLYQNKNLSFEELNKQFKLKFNCSQGPTLIDRKNSGHIDIDNQKLELEFNQNIKSKYVQLCLFFDSEYSEKVKNYKYAPNFKINNILKNDTDVNSHKNILDFHDIKQELKYILFNFYKTKYNAELLFESTILDSIGFNSCRGCNI